MSKTNQPGRDRLLIREIYGERHYASWRELIADEHAAAVTACEQSNRTESARAGHA